MELVFLLAGAAFGFLIASLYFKNKTSSILPENTEAFKNLENEKARLEERASNLNNDAQLLKTDLATEREKLNAANTRLTKAEEAFKNMQEKLDNQKTELEQLQKKFTVEFENIANRVLEEKSQKFTDQNKTNMDIILNPLKEKIKEFEEKVDKTYKAESAERITLKAEIKSLVEMNKQISEEANNLAKALKGDNKMQGNWGEIILERILERSGLIKDEEYKTQVSTQNEENKRIQPDVIVYLPDNKHIIIDAKVSLVSYESYVNAKTEDERPFYMKGHIDSIKSHIKNLSEKNYQASKDFNAPDFVLLFVAIESSFSIAIQTDNDLFNFAWDRKIVIVSPSTLLATLRTIASVWKQEKQTRNAIEIAEQSGRLYDKFVGFVEDLARIGVHIAATQNVYDESMKKLATGSGNLIKRAENIKKLGAKNSKSIPQIFLTTEDDEKLIEDV